MSKSWSYIKGPGDFINKTNNLITIPDNAILITADVVGLYPNIPHETGLKALREALDKQEHYFNTRINSIYAEIVKKNLTYF